MRHWNYRVIKKSNLKVEDREEIEYAIHEVYYDDDGKIVSWSEKPAAIVDDSIANMHHALDRMWVALNKPILIEVENKLMEEN